MHGVSFHLGQCLSLSCSLPLSVCLNASPAYSSARSFCKSHLLSRYVSLALLLSVSLAQCISILLFRLFSLQVDPVRTNPPQSDQTGESFFLTGRFRNYSCEVCEFPPGRPVAHFMFFIGERPLFALPRFHHDSLTGVPSLKAHVKPMEKMFCRRGKGGTGMSSVPEHASRSQTVLLRIVVTHAQVFP